MKLSFKEEGKNEHFVFSETWISTLWSEHRRCYMHHLTILVLTDPGHLHLTHTICPLQLSVASPLFDDEQVLVCWVLSVRFFPISPHRLGSPHPFSLLWLWLHSLHLSSPRWIYWSSVCVSLWWPRRNLLWFPRPLLLLLFYLACFPFAPTSGKVICFIKNYFTRCVSWRGKLSLGFPQFDIATASMLLVFTCFVCRTSHFMVFVKKDVVVGAFVRCMMRLMVVFIMDDFLLLLWWSQSKRALKACGENAILLQFWGKQKPKGLWWLALIFFFFAHVWMIPQYREHQEAEPDTRKTQALLALSSIGIYLCVFPSVTYL